MWSQVRILSLRTIVKVKLAQNRVVKSYASLVQLVERRSPKPDVVGSSPTGRETVKYHVYMIYIRAKSCLEHYILLHWEWRDDGVAESTSLLMKRTSNRTRGSNPLLSVNRWNRNKSRFLS